MTTKYHIEIGPYEINTILSKEEMMQLIGIINKLIEKDVDLEIKRFKVTPKSTSESPDSAQS